jgi:hypothetical protein
MSLVRYIAGIDPYKEDGSVSAVVITIPRQILGWKKVRGFKRLSKIGWAYEVKILNDERN